jgi:CubicO group peptidase (beta-lactamase class C family)
VIGCAIEGASSEKHVDFVRENVFRPAGMTVTQWDDRLAVIAHRTRFYSKAKSGVVENANFLDASYKIPGGEWLSSADDMAKFEIAILSDQLMKRTTRRDVDLAAVTATTGSGAHWPRVGMGQQRDRRRHRLRP